MLALLILNVTELPLDEAYKLGVPAKAVPAIPNADKTKTKAESFIKNLFFINLLFVSNVNYFYKNLKSDIFKLKSHYIIHPFSDIEKLAKT